MEKLQCFRAENFTRDGFKQGFATHVSFNVARLLPKLAVQKGEVCVPVSEARASFCIALGVENLGILSRILPGQAA